MKDKRIEAKQDYMKGMTYQQLADHYNVPSIPSNHGKDDTAGKDKNTVKAGALDLSSISFRWNDWNHGKMDGRTSLDIIWDQIQIQYAAIIRAQRIMHVADQDDMIKELKRRRTCLLH